MLLQTFNYRNDERGCLSGTRSGHSNHIEALKKDRDCASLNGCWQAIAFLYDGFVDFWGEVVRLEAATLGLFITSDWNHLNLT